jgi:hypothetical protein
MQRRGAKQERKRSISRARKALLDKLVAEAIVDCYNESEQVTGLYTMIADNLALPFETTVLGVAVTDHRGRRRLSKLTTRSPFNA